MVVISEIEDLVDHVDEILGEIEEELLQRDQLIQRLEQFIRNPSEIRRRSTPGSSPDIFDPKLGAWLEGQDPTRSVEPTSFIRQDNPDGSPDLIRRDHPDEPSPVRDLFKLVTRDLAEIKSASERARECLFAQVSYTVL